MPTLIVNNLFKLTNQIQDLKTEHENELNKLESKAKEIFLLKFHENALKLKINPIQPNSLIIHLNGFNKISEKRIRQLKEVLGLSNYEIKLRNTNEFILIFYDESSTGATNHEK
jgi:hypothetical protein